MAELKRSAGKTEPQAVIPTQHSFHNNEGHAHGSLPNLHSMQMNYDSLQSGFTQDSSIQRQSIIQVPNRLAPPSLSRYSGGGIIRQRSVERREYNSSAPYSRSRSPSPNTNAPVKVQPVILSHREKFRAPLSQSNRLQLPSNTSGRQRSHSDSRLSDLQSIDMLPLCIHDQSAPISFSSNYTSPQFVPQHQLQVRQTSVIVNSPGAQRRNTEADIFHTESPKNPIRKVSEPTGPRSPQIIVTFHDTSFQTEVQNPIDTALASSTQGENRQNLYESYRVRRPSNTGSPESESGYSNHSSPGSPGITEQQSFIDSELEEKLSEFRLNNPNEFDTLEKHLFPEEHTLSFNSTEHSNLPNENMLYNDIDTLLSNPPPTYMTLGAASVCEQEVDYDGDEILKRLES